ncbi:MAG: binding protein, DksA/TraR family protein [Parcubacteria group bacterium GW2011_GWF2_39_8b]|uniref:Zinc finger DksA/TraR C4-type domain-containing protein n=3 Tax=Candidatus Zambryskiibacteriota TaxID=1817925 RepID=A0A1G2T5H0_9BACT|nr:MAG: binding protein, DksA/TraR family protein [Parcubacteria group bacterium GW2011_GWF2_39_8b]KKR45688.1 MAG: binding protein, DksA/TraR family protein [Parcubacteria group bacterium GW2011_GWA2_40_14]OHA92535.1 MAG: hypothetical protein A2W58_00855 [Candidatus Zambryskibacteria bacterium RIFCSPHIGHO2_02_38_10.5]OHA97177.1 MAG: hypothetical protein A3C63_01000 [Candidatus Zambryskibacteria bacterium RIFCSPHIGHO2_02_FULL_39_82]OHA98006.1 MAG: hypothetical protein A3E32_02040 [Candidatus Zam
MEQNTQQFKEKLRNEYDLIEKELTTLGRKNPSNPEDWEATKGTLDTDRADETEVADSIEQYDNNKAILEQLEIRLNEVKRALEKIENGTYGKCEVSGEDIELDRLEANPAAKTCKAHMNV